MNTTTQLSQALGLTPNEIMVYQGYVEHPLLSAAKMSTVLTMDKSSTYRSVANLVTYGLLLPVPVGEVMAYKAVDPAEISERYDKRMRDLQDSKAAVQSFITSLLSKKTRRTHVRVESGLSAVQKALSESLQSKEKLIRELYKIYTFSKQKSHIQFILDFLHKRVEHGIAIRQFSLHSDMEAPEIRAIMKTSPELLKEVRKLPLELDDMNSIRIWDDTTNFYSEDELGETIVITITDAYITSFMKKVYDFIWNRSKRINGTTEYYTSFRIASQ